MRAIILVAIGLGLFGAAAFQSARPSQAQQASTALQPGWTLAIYAGANLEVEQALGSCAASVEAVFYWDASAQAYSWWFKSGPTAVNTLASISSGAILWVNASASCSWNFPSGTPAPPSPPATPAATPTSTPIPSPTPAPSLSLTSSAFGEGQTIPVKYTCSGQDISPPLAWSGAPQATASFALIVDDPDAPGGIYTHWVIYNIPGPASSFAESVPTTPQLSDGSLQGLNSWNQSGYGGPCPPTGSAPHHYQFRLYALDSTLGLVAGATKDAVLQAMQGRIIAQVQLTGLYQR